MFGLYTFDARCIDFLYMLSVYDLSNQIYSYHGNPYHFCFVLSFTSSVLQLSCIYCPPLESRGRHTTDRPRLRQTEKGITRCNMLLYYQWPTCIMDPYRGCELSSMRPFNGSRFKFQEFVSHFQHSHLVFYTMSTHVVPYRRGFSAVEYDAALAGLLISMAVAEGASGLLPGANAIRRPFISLWSRFKVIDIKN